MLFFGNLDSLSKLNLMKAYCFGLYGSKLWNLSNSCIESVKIALCGGGAELTTNTRVHGRRRIVERPLDTEVSCRVMCWRQHITVTRVAYSILRPDE